MGFADWLVVVIYLAAMLGVAVWAGRRQNSRRDYFLGGNDMRPISLATSTIATQCSTNSLLGAPAFVGFAAGGGMLWLQYELAVPLAMLLLIWVLGSVRKSGHISVYAFLQERLGLGARLLASGVFLVFRGIATGVTVYGAAIMVTLLIEVSYVQAVLLLMGVTILYDLLGGMRAVVISDVIQMVLIIAAVSVSLFLLVGQLGGIDAIAQAHVDTQRIQAVQPHWGFSGEGNYGLWPMLIGGLFLYMAYYGCDQSQAQRVLSSQSVAHTERVLLLNGVLRFPVVLLYCLLGLALAAYAGQHDGFVSNLPLTSGSEPNYNLVFPSYVLENFPPGVIGLVMVGIFAAAMSSIDSSLNALSASTVEDFVSRVTPAEAEERWYFLMSKLATVGWGLFAVFFSFRVESIAPTVLEAINKIGSVANGPLLSLFLLALLLPGVGQVRAIAGFAAGFLCNILLWLLVPEVSWLWWNVIGCLVAIAVALLPGLVRVRVPDVQPAVASILVLLSMGAGIALIALLMPKLVALAA